MDKAQYLEMKKQRQQAEDSVKGRLCCPKCFRPEKQCLCAKIHPFDPGIKIVILIHPMEAKRERVGTGRLSHLCLENSELISGIDFTENAQVNQLIADPRYYPVVLYPGKNAHNISEVPLEMKDFNGKMPLIFVIDGTWPCAKKMMKLSKNLHLLPRMCFTPTTPSRFEIKMQPDPMCLSTIESIHFFLGEWEKNLFGTVSPKRDNLMEVFEEVVTFQKKCALDPELPSYRQKSYRPPEVRKPSKKWEKYNLFFE